MNDDIRALLPLVDLFEELGVEHSIGGSIASSVHGVARWAGRLGVRDLLDRARAEAGA